MPMSEETTPPPPQSHPLLTFVSSDPFDAPDPDLIGWLLTFDAPDPNNLLSQSALTTWRMVILFAESPTQSNKDGPLPASKKSIEDMPTVKITELDLLGSESCAICLGEYEVGGEAKEMPCKHIYHTGCIEKWLRIHRSCPFCRYEIPKKKGIGMGN